MTNTKLIDGVTHVWSIMDNAWVTEDYWRYINAERARTADARRRVGTNYGVQVSAVREPVKLTHPMDSDPFAGIDSDAAPSIWD
jgi:hypothetical protein